MARIVVGIDARNGNVATDGWAATSSIRAVDLALSLQDAGVAAIVYTDIGRDGMLTGLNLDQTVAMATAVATPVIASAPTWSDWLDPSALPCWSGGTADETIAAAAGRQIAAASPVTPSVTHSAPCT